MSGSLFSPDDPPERDYLWGFYNCPDLQLLRSRRSISKALKESLSQAGIETFSGASHKFPGGGSGITAVEIIGASCADIHTWPEFGTAIVRCFACGDKDEQVWEFLRRMMRRLWPDTVYEIPERKIPTTLPKVIPPTWRLVNPAAYRPGPAIRAFLPLPSDPRP